MSRGENESTKKQKRTTNKFTISLGELFKKVGQEEIAIVLGVSKSTVGKWAPEIHRVAELARRELNKICKKHGIKENMKIFEA